MVRARHGGHRAQNHATQSEQQQQVRAVYDALERQDHGALQELAFTRRGFCSGELRRTVWLHLLGLSPQQALDARWRRELALAQADEKEARVIHADVQRSVYSWDVHTGIRKSVRASKRVQLSEVMHATLRRHGGKLAYFQGFHDITLVFLEVGTPTQAFHMVERIALFMLSDQLCWPFERGVLPLLGVLFGLLELLDASVAAALAEADCAEMHFALPWVLTWFAHSLPRLHQQVMRLFDCLLVSHPATILYFVVALLLQHKDAILRTRRELPDMVSLLQAIQLQDLDVDDWAERTWQLLQQVPPEELLQRLAPRHRHALPPTSPLLHYPHPWMSLSKAAIAAGEADMSALSPVYMAGKPGQPCGACAEGPVAMFGRWPRTAWTKLRALVRRQGPAIALTLSAVSAVAAVLRVVRSRPSRPPRP